jgi:hypothetical protein
MTLCAPFFGEGMNHQPEGGDGGIGDAGEPSEELEVGEHEGPFAFRGSLFVVRRSLES